MIVVEPAPRREPAKAPAPLAPNGPVAEPVSPTVALPVPDAADNLAKPASAFDPSRPPDDPGVEAAEANDNQPRRFRLF
jgi:uncharacterized membrane-anchored protein